MKDIAVKDSAPEEKAGDSTEPTNMPVETKREMRSKKEEGEDSADKILNSITAGVENLNIKVSNNDTESKLNIKTEEVDDDEKADTDDFTERGPHGGRPVDFMQNGPVNIMPKNVSIPLMMPDGQYYQCHQQQQIPAQRNGNRRTFDESEDYGQPVKFNRPMQPYFEPSQLQQPPQNFNFGNMSQTLQNDLSDMNKFQPQLQPMPFQPNAMFHDMNFAGQMETKTVQIINATSGGKVTVQTPMSPNANIVDELLRECEMNNPGFPSAAPQFTNLPNITSPPPNNNEFTGVNFSEHRRRSQDTDSGLESEGVGSPWSEQAPSPGNGMYNPPSVDSGCERSPMHESQSLPGMSPPKYAGAPSPASYRATPSPAGTSGYGSPGQPQLEDEFFSPDKQEELDMLLQVMENVVNEEQSKKQQQGQRQLPTTVQAFMPPGQNLVPQTVQQAPMQGVRPIQMPAQPVIAPSTFSGQNGVPVTTSTQPIIILQPHQPTMSMPQVLILNPVHGQATQPPKKNLPRKILPKVSIQPSIASTSGQSTNASLTCKPGVTMATKTSPATNRNITQQSNTPDKTQQNKLLMIARRTVANIPREDLRRSDEEGDTYLHIAVCKTDKYMVQALLERLRREGLDSLVDQENNKRQTPLYLAVFINQPVMVAMFIKFQANVNVLAQNLSSDGMTTEVKAAIHVAASQGKEYQRTLVELLRARDISINIVNNYGQTALHCAIMAHGKAKRQSTERISSVEIIQTLIKAGADPSAQDKKSGKTPLMYAIEQKNHELVETILKCVEPEKVKNVVKTQAFDGSSCIKIAEGLKGSFDVEIWNKLWNSLQSAANGSMARYQFQSPAVY